MLDVDGVLIDGRPEDGRHWQTSIEEDFGFAKESLNEHFFLPHWDDIVVGRKEMMEHLVAALAKVAPHVGADEFVSYWFERDSRLVQPLLEEMGAARAAGVRVFLATNQEHLRAEYLMSALGLRAHVDGIFYSAELGAKKPEAEFFTRVQKRVGVRGEEMLLIDDSAANVEAAVKAGWRAMVWTRESIADLREALRA